MCAELMDTSERLIELGRIVAAHGLQGWVKVLPHSAHATVLRQVGQWQLQSGQGGVRPVTVQATRLQGHAVVAQLQGVSDRDQAEALRGLTVCVPRSAFPAPDADEYYWVDLVGCLLYGKADGVADPAGTNTPALLGEVIEVNDNGAHAVLTVARLRIADDATQVPVHDAKGRPVMVLVPFVAAHVHGVDVAARRIDTDWPVDF